MRVSLTFAILVMILLLSCRAVFADDDGAVSIERDERRLKAYDKEIKREKGEISRIRSEERSVFEELRRIQRHIDNKEEEAKALYAAKNEIDKIVFDSYLQVLELKERIVNQREQLEKRSVALYKISDMQYLQVLFSSSSYVDILKRYKYLKLILNQDSRLIDEYDNNKRLLSEKAEIIKKEKEKLDEIIKKVKNKGEEILADKNAKEILLRKVRREKSYHLRVLKELSAAANKLEKLVIKLQKNSADSKLLYKEKFSDFKGVLETPVRGNVISYFGKERVSKFNTYLFNNGIKISAKVGQDVIAVFSGRVVFADWFRGYGKVIIMEHGEGYYTVYSHLSRLIKGAGSLVQRGEVIAKSGDTGSLSGACLYFEVRHKGRSVDPMDWLEPNVSGMNAAR